MTEFTERHTFQQKLINRSYHDMLDIIGKAPRTCYFVRIGAVDHKELLKTEPGGLIIAEIDDIKPFKPVEKIHQEPWDGKGIF